MEVPISNDSIKFSSRGYSLYFDNITLYAYQFLPDDILGSCPNAFLKKPDNSVK